MYTDSFSSKGFASWPRGEPKGPAKSKAEYAAHWRHCGGSQKPHTLGSPFPCTGTPQIDPRVWYSFPGGQTGKARHSGPQSDLYSRGKDAMLPAAKSLKAYIKAFCKTNKLTA